MKEKKKCSKCGEEKGERKRIYQKAYRELHKKEYRTYMSDYYNTHKKEYYDRGRNYQRTNKEKVRVDSRNYQKACYENLKDWYIIHLLRDRIKIPTHLIPLDLIELKRTIILIKREIKQRRTA